MYTTYTTVRRKKTQHPKYVTPEFNTGNQSIFFKIIHIKFVEPFSNVNYFGK